MSQKLLFIFNPHSGKGQIKNNLVEIIDTCLLYTSVGGKEKKDRVMSDKERKIVSYHEVGHALVSALQKNTEPDVYKRQYYF